MVEFSILFGEMPESSVASFLAVPTPSTERAELLAESAVKEIGIINHHDAPRALCAFLSRAEFRHFSEFGYAQAPACADVDGFIEVRPYYEALPESTWTAGERWAHSNQRSTKLFRGERTN